MKLEVGDYVRTKKGKIAKIVSKEDVYGGLHREEIVFILDIGERLAIHSKKVVKSSKNIIDLIEEGDYVNGRPVFINEYGYLEQTCINADGDVYYETLRVENIKDIVTKEQFDSMKYEVDSNE